MTRNAFVEKLRAAQRGPLIELVDLSKVYGQVSVFHGVTVAIETGAYFALRGPSGSGKTTLLDYEAQGWLEELGDGSFRYVFDAVGKLTRGAFLRVLRADGFYVSSGLGPWSQNLIFAAAAPVMRDPKVRFPVPTEVPATLELVSRLLAERRYSPLVDQHYDLDDVREAFEYADSGKFGTVLIDLAAG